MHQAFTGSFTGLGAPALATSAIPEVLERRGGYKSTPRPGASSPTVVVGIGGARQNAAAAICVDGRLHAVCEQERISRIRRAGLEAGTFPEEAVESVLRLANVARS